MESHSGGHLYPNGCKKVVENSQHGFTEGKSCLSNLIAFYDRTASRVDEGTVEDVVCFEFSWALDTHNVIVGKLSGSGHWDSEAD